MQSQIIRIDTDSLCMPAEAQRERDVVQEPFLKDGQPLRHANTNVPRIKRETFIMQSLTSRVITHPHT